MIPQGESKIANRIGEPAVHSSQVLSSSQLEELLEKTIVDFDYDEVAFIDVVGRLQNDHKINVIIDQSAQDDSLSEDTIVSCHLNNVTLKTALRSMLKTHNATFSIDEGILKFISLDVASDPEFFRTKMFDCTELLKKIAATDSRIGKACGRSNSADTEQWRSIRRRSISYRPTAWFRFLGTESYESRH